MFCHYLQVSGVEPPGEHAQVLATLAKLGFKVNPNWKVCPGIDEVARLHSAVGIEARRPRL